MPLPQRLQQQDGDERAREGEQRGEEARGSHRCSEGHCCGRHGPVGRQDKLGEREGGGRRKGKGRKGRKR